MNGTTDIPVAPLPNFPDRPRILLVDDEQEIADVIRRLLEIHGFDVTIAFSAQEALASMEKQLPELVLSDVVMPGKSGYELCGEIRRLYDDKVVPIILLTGKDWNGERLKGLEAGADDLITKPIDKNVLLNRIHSLVKIKTLHDTVENEAHKLAENEKVLESKVDLQRNQLGQLKRFFSPQIADFVLSHSTSGTVFESRRKDVTVVFLDLRGFTAFAEKALPEQVMEVLGEYYAQAGDTALKFNGTIGKLAGDGMMFFLNDPVEVKNHPAKAVEMALEMRNVMIRLRDQWVPKGYELDFGIGMATGRATIGAVGFEKYWDYTVIGSVTNLASRLCDEARQGQILASEKFLGAAGLNIQTQPLGVTQLKGFSVPVKIFNILAKGKV